MTTDQQAMLARADAALCLLLPAALIALGDVNAAKQLHSAAPIITSLGDLDRWYAVYVRPCTAVGDDLHAYAYDIPEALCDFPERFEEIVTDFERACRKAIAGILED